MADLLDDPENLRRLLDAYAAQDELPALERQRKLADTLRGAQAPQGQMVGGRYITDPFGAMTSLLSNIKGAQLGNNLDAREAQIRQRTRAIPELVDAPKLKMAMQAQRQGMDLAAQKEAETERHNRSTETADKWHGFSAPPGSQPYKIDTRTGESAPVGTATPALPKALGAGGGAGATDAAVEQAAKYLLATGNMLPLGQGRDGTALRAKVLNRAAELDPTANIANNKAGFHADSSSLASLQKQVDAVNAFEGTALKNLDQFAAVAGSVIDSGSPLFNKPLRAAAGALGSGDQARFEAARQTALNEVAKVLNSSSGAGALSDSARHEVENMLSGAASMSQIKKTIELLRQDMHNRRISYQDQIQQIRTRTGGGQPVAAEETKTVNGKTYKKSGGKWFEADR